MAETRAEQDRQNRQEGFKVLPNGTVLISFYLNEGGKKVLIHKEKSRFPFSTTADQDLMRNWANTQGKCVRQRTVRQETTKYKAGTLPLNMYQTATHQRERLEFEEQPGLSEDEGREGPSTSRDPGDDQQSEYDDDSSDSDSDDFVVEKDGAVHHIQNSELGFLFEAPRTRGGRIVKTSNKALLWM